MHTQIHTPMLLALMGMYVRTLKNVETKWVWKWQLWLPIQLGRRVNPSVKCSNLEIRAENIIFQRERENNAVKETWGDVNTIEDPAKHY